MSAISNKARLGTAAMLFGVARKGTRKAREPLPPPLPPETRTVGQLVAETINLYRRHFWHSLALGLGPAAAAVGLVVFVPFPILFRAFVLPALALFAFCGLSVPAAVIERLSPRAALRRGVQLGKADYVHALGSLCTLAIVYFLSRTVLMLLLRGQGDATERIAGFLADLVLSPLIFLGAALLYYDQAARVRSSKRDDALPRGKPAPPGPVRHPSSR